MKTNINNLLSKTHWLFSKYKYSWQLWLSVCILVILAIASYAGATMIKNAQTTLETSRTDTASKTENKNSKKTTDSTQKSTATTPASDSQNQQPGQSATVAPTSDSKVGSASGNSSSKPGTTSSTPNQNTGTPSTPVTPPAPVTPVTSPSGQVVPRGDFGSWKHIFYDDFTKDAALGSWGEDWNGEKIVYTGAQGQQWRAYPKSYKDTYNQRPYRSDQVLSVKNSMLNFWLHNVDGQPAGANPSPLISSGSQYQTYGRYSARFKVDAPNLSEYYVAWLLWPQSERWPQDGEFDFPEGNLAGNVGGFHHYSGAGSCTNGCQDVANIPAGTKFTDWHTYTIEWTPGRIKYILDGNVVLDSTKWVPSGPMRWQLQTETNGNGTHSGNLMVDWVSVWRYQS